MFFTFYPISMDYFYHICVLIVYPAITHHNYRNILFSVYTVIYTYKNTIHVKNENTMKITCESFLQQIVPFLEDELSNSQMESMANHVETCHSCAELASSLSDVHLSSEMDITGTQTQKNELQHDFWSDMDAVLDAELNKNFKSVANTESKDSTANTTEKSGSIFLIPTMNQKSNNSASLKIQQKSNYDSTDISKDPSDNFSIQSHRINTSQISTSHFREMILAALCLLFLLWGYHHQQQNIALEHKLQMQNIEIQHLRISIEKRPNSPQRFQDPYAIPANYVPSRLDL